MKNFCLALLMALLLMVPSAQAQVKLHFATQQEAREMIIESDAYTEGWGQFDIDCRALHPHATREQLLSFMQNQCLDFTPAEEDSVRSSLNRILARAEREGYYLPLPDEIVFVKTTMHEEGDALGYTRRNCIYLCPNLCEVKNLDRLVSHELFHILTRSSLAFKKRMYKTIDFKLLKESISFPQDIIDKRISNPDISKYDAYARLTLAGKERPCTMMIYTDKCYMGGSFFDYIKIGFIPLDRHHRPVVKDGHTVIYPMKACRDFYKKVGFNTGYVINPEECLADNFSIVMTRQGNTPLMPTPALIEAIKKALRKH